MPARDLQSPESHSKHGASRPQKPHHRTQTFIATKHVKGGGGGRENRQTEIETETERGGGGGGARERQTERERERQR